MVNITEQILARRQTIIYGVKRGKIPLALRPCVPPQKKEAGSRSLVLFQMYFVVMVATLCQKSFCSETIDLFAGLFAFCKNSYLRICQN